MLEVFDAHETVEVLSAHLSWPNLKKGWWDSNLGVKVSKKWVPTFKKHPLPKCSSKVSEESRAVQNYSPTWWKHAASSATFHFKLQLQTSWTHIWPCRSWRHSDTACLLKVSYYTCNGTNQLISHSGRDTVCASRYQICPSIISRIMSVSDSSANINGETVNPHFDDRTLGCEEPVPVNDGFFFFRDTRHKSLASCFVACWLFWATNRAHRAYCCLLSTIYYLISTYQLTNITNGAILIQWRQWQHHLPPYSSICWQSATDGG